MQHFLLHGVLEIVPEFAVHRGFRYFVKVQFTYGFSFFTNIMIKIKSFNSKIKRLIQDLDHKTGTLTRTHFVHSRAMPAIIPQDIQT